MSEIVDSSLRKAVKGTTFVFIGMVMSILLWFVTKVLIVRGTTKEELGLYSLAVAVVGMFSTIANMGLQEGATRHISMFLAEGRREDAGAAAKSSFQISMTTSLAASLGLYFFSAPIAHHVFYMPELETPLRAISFFALFEVLTKVLDGIIRGHGNVRARVYYINIGQPLFFLGLLGVFMLMELPFVSIVYGYLFAMMMSFVGIVSYGYRKIGLNPFALKGGRFRKELMRFSVPLLGVVVMGMVLSWTDTLMLGRYSDAGSVGVYNVSISLVRLLTFALSAASVVFMPIAGEMYARKQLTELNRTYQVLTKWVVAATLPLFFVLFFFPEMIIMFLFGDRYVVSSVPLRILTLGFMFYVFVGANSMLLMVLGLSRKLMNVSIFGTVMNILLNYILIKRMGFGVIGASVATAFTYVSIYSINSVILYWHSGIHPITAKYLRPILGSGVIGLIIYIIAKSLPLYFWMLPLYFMLFIGGYMASLFLTRSLDREDVAMFETISVKTGLRLDIVRRLIGRFAHE